MLRDSSIRCTTSLCALPMINMGYLDRDWYEGIVQKLKWNVPIRETDAADIAAFTSRNLLRNQGVNTQNLSPAAHGSDGNGSLNRPSAIGPIGKNTVSDDELTPEQITEAVQQYKKSLQRNVSGQTTAGTAPPEQ